MALFVKFNRRSHIGLTAEPNQAYCHQDKRLCKSLIKSGPGDEDAARRLWYVETATEILDEAWKDIRAVCPGAGFQGAPPKLVAA